MAIVGAEVINHREHRSLDEKSYNSLDMDGESSVSFGHFPWPQSVPFMLRSRTNPWDYEEY